MKQYRGFDRLSFRSRFYKWVLSVHKKLSRPKPFDLHKSRIARLKNMRMACGDPCGGVSIEEVNFAGQRAFCYTPEVLSRPNQTMLYLHGGAFIGSNIDIYNGFVSRFSRDLGVKCFSLDYPLAPEYPFPSAVNAVSDFYGEMLRSGEEGQEIIFAGDSAGAGLCLSAALKLKEEGKSLPAGFILLSPWVDLSGSGESVASNKNKDFFVSNQLLTNASKLYCGEYDPLMPEISPLFADLSGLGPVYLFAADQELLLSDSERLHDKLCECGVDVQLTVWEGGQHAFIVAARLFKETDLAIAEINGFLNRHF